MREVHLDVLTSDAASFLLHQMSFNPKFGHLRNVCGLARVPLEEQDVLKLLSTFLMSANARMLPALDLTDMEKYSLQLVEIIDNAQSLQALNTLLLRGRSYVVQRESSVLALFFNSFELHRITELDFSGSDFDGQGLLYLLNSAFPPRLRRLTLAGCRNLSSLVYNTSSVGNYY